MAIEIKDSSVVSSLPWPKVMCNVLHQLHRCDDLGVPQTVWHSSHVPHMNVPDYLMRLKNHFILEDYQLFVIAMEFIMRGICAGTLQITELTVHRVLLIALVIAKKWHDEVNLLTIGYYAKSGGVTVKEMIRLEQTFLVAINHRLHIDWIDFRKRRDNMWQCHMFHESMACLSLRIPPRNATHNSLCVVANPGTHDHGNSAHGSRRKPKRWSHRKNKKKILLFTT